MKQPKVFVVDGDPGVTRMFMGNNWRVVWSPDEADLIQFTGGADVSPMLYGEPKHYTTYCDPARDQHEADVFFDNYDKPKAGICRGGQFLNVMSGGSMYQDVDNHAIPGTHKAFYYDGDDNERVVMVTSTHHQMMRPDRLMDYSVFMVANLTTRLEDGHGHEQLHSSDEDVEGVYYNKTNSLCFQPHPEYVDPYHECQELYFEVLKRFFDLEAK